MAVRARYGFSHVFTIRMRSRGPIVLIDEVVAARATDGCVSGHDPVGVARTRYCGMSMYIESWRRIRHMILSLFTTGSRSDWCYTDLLWWNSFGSGHVSPCDI